MASEDGGRWADIRNKLIGLGEDSVSKSYYPELKERLEELERFRALLDLSNDAVILAEAGTGRIVDFNQATCAILGCASDDLVGLKLTEIMDEKLLADAGIPSIEGTACLRDMVVTRMAHGKKEGVAVEVSMRVELFGGKRYAVLVARDISRRLKAERALARLNQRLEQLVALRTRELEKANERLRKIDEIKSSFFSSVAHELRTPLTSIFGFVKLINRDFKKYCPREVNEPEVGHHRSQRILENLRIIEAEGERLTRLINDFLDLTKIESGSMVWNDVLVEPETLIKDSAQAMRGQFSLKSPVRLVLDLKGELPRVRVDPDRFKQLIINLLGNAFKFTNAGDVVLAAHTSDDGGLCVSVKDNGPGISREDLETIFERFRQGRIYHGGETVARGTGLGLAICRDIVRHYGGTIRAESEEGEGSTFVFELPPGRPVAADRAAGG